MLGIKNSVKNYGTQLCGQHNAKIALVVIITRHSAFCGVMRSHLLSLMSPVLENWLASNPGPKCGERVPRVGSADFLRAFGGYRAPQYEVRSIALRSYRPHRSCGNSSRRVCHRALCTWLHRTRESVFHRDQRLEGEEATRIRCLRRAMAEWVRGGRDMRRCLTRTAESREHAERCNFSAYICFLLAMALVNRCTAMGRNCFVGIGLVITVCPSCPHIFLWF